MTLQSVDIPESPCLNLADRGGGTPVILKRGNREEMSGKPLMSTKKREKENTIICGKKNSHPLTENR